MYKADYSNDNIPTDKWLRSSGTHRKKRHRVENSSIFILTGFKKNPIDVTIEVEVEGTPENTCALHGRFLHLCLRLRLFTLKTPIRQKQIDAFMTYDNREVATNTADYIRRIEEFTGQRGRLPLTYTNTGWRVDIKALRQAIQNWDDSSTLAYALATKVRAISFWLPIRGRFFQTRRAYIPYHGF